MKSRLRHPLEHGTGWRELKNGAFGVLVYSSGFGVVVALLLLILFLGYQAIPLVMPARMNLLAQYDVPEEALATPHDDALQRMQEGDAIRLMQDGDALRLMPDDVALRLTAQGRVTAFSALTGRVLAERSVIKSHESPPVRSAFSSAEAYWGAWLFADGSVRLAWYHFIAFERDIKDTATTAATTSTVTATTATAAASTATAAATIEFSPNQRVRPWQETAHSIGGFVIEANDQRLTLAGVWAETSRVEVHLARYNLQTLAANGTFGEPETAIIPLPSGSPVKQLALNGDQTELLILRADGALSRFIIASLDQVIAAPWRRQEGLPPQHHPVDIAWLSGGHSVLVAFSDGSVGQWSTSPPTPTAPHPPFEMMRLFDTEPGGVPRIYPETKRKVFALSGAHERLMLFHATSGRRLISGKFLPGTIESLAWSPTAEQFLMRNDEGHYAYVKVHNPHPEASWQALWKKVRYEGHAHPEYLWQAIDTHPDHEPKLSLVPLLFGTLKATSYAMVIAMPLALLAAVYCGFFMPEALRRRVKPAVEILSALPTVVIGFLFGAWLVPWFDQHLVGLFVLPVVILATLALSAIVWRFVICPRCKRPPVGWEFIFLLVPLGLAIAASFALSPWLESLVFGGAVHSFITHTLGMDYDQRNGLIVGLAMGIAVIPTVFTLADDAIRSVPRSLVHGALALGASPWQTLCRVVLTAASPGIFAAMMLGMGRAVGETMIVLMVSGNAPVVDASLFQGLRTFGANIAIELSESSVGGTHFRLLMLSALLLFLLTFLLNTAADIVRRTLRGRHAY